jgi:hypothetical protein
MAEPPKRHCGFDAKRAQRACDALTGMAERAKFPAKKLQRLVGEQRLEP